MNVLSVVIPAYNEERTIGILLEDIRSVPLKETGFKIEIIVVDDGSTDKTAKIVSSFKNVRYIHQTNQGKGAAVQRGVRECTGDFLLVQDADLEYDSRDYIPMLHALPTWGAAVIYGSRVKGQLRGRGWRLFPGKHPAQGIGPWGANWIISFWILVLYGRWITDPLTAYKLYPTQLIREMDIKSTGFEADHEMTAKLIRMGMPIIEVPVRYTPRSVEEGKKIRAIDGVIALWTLLKFRLTN
jgi:dolichol-phosphate mannosyltransferase